MFVPGVSCPVFFGRVEAVEVFVGLKGFALVELLVGMAIMLVFAGVAFKLVSRVMQKARVVSSKAQIAQLAQMLESVKDDTAFYPVGLTDLLAQNAPAGLENGWRGPYGNTIPSDPWQTGYFYNIPSSSIFKTPPVIRGRGRPATYNFSFHATAQTAKIRVENYGVASAQIWVNGERIFRQNDFNHRPPYPKIQERDIILLNGANTMEIWISSVPTSYFTFEIYGYFPTDEYFILGSYGRDSQAGGEGFDSDIVWRSDVYPNFQ